MDRTPTSQHINADDFNPDTTTSTLPAKDVTTKTVDGKHLLATAVSMTTELKSNTDTEFKEEQLSTPNDRPAAAAGVKSAKKASTVRLPDASQILPDGAKRDRKRREVESSPETVSSKKKSKGPAGDSPIFVDVTQNAGKTEELSFDEKRRLLIERLNQIEKLRMSAAASAANAANSPPAKATTVDPVTVQAGPSATMSEGGTNASPVQPGGAVALPGSPKDDLVPGSALSTAEVQETPTVRRVRTPSVLLTTQTGELLPSGVPDGQRAQFLHCRRIVKQFLAKREAACFCAPILELWRMEDIPGYFDIITKPMDFRTVLKQLESGAYLKSLPVEPAGATSKYPGRPKFTFDSSAFADDVRLIFRNSMLYNKPGDFFFEAARSYLCEFEISFEQLPPLGADYLPQKKVAHPDKLKSGGKSKKTKKLRTREETEKKKVPKTAPKPPKPAKSPAPPAPKPKEPKPENEEDLEGLSVRELETKLAWLKHQKKTMEANSRVPVASPKTPTYTQKGLALAHIPMTYEEKKTLGDNISKLPYDKLEKLLQIYAKHAGALVKNNDEIEIEIDNISNLGLREMEAYVESVQFKGKKSRKPREPIENPITALEIDIEKYEAVLLQKKAEENKLEKVNEGPHLVDSESDSDSDSDSDASSDNSDGEE